MLNKIRSFLKELIIITIGVLIALFVSNLRENIQAEKYYKASIETIKQEVESNYANLKDVVEKQTSLLDTINKYSADRTTSHLILVKGGGLKMAPLNHSGLGFYKKIKSA
ncbi:MAG: hypothetical protein JXR65_11680 [Bacteroidales bacterium]|nr:hypothetical protein [Bacteroidales bacterium]